MTTTHTTKATWEAGEVEIAGERYLAYDYSENALDDGRCVRQGTEYYSRLSWRHETGPDYWTVTWSEGEDVDENVVYQDGGYAPFEVDAIVTDVQPSEGWE